MTSFFFNSYSTGWLRKLFNFLNKIFDPWSKRVAGGRTGVSTLIFPELEVGSRLDFQSVTIKQASSVAKSNKWPSLKNDKRLKKKKISDLFFCFCMKKPLRRMCLVQCIYFRYFAVTKIWSKQTKNPIINEVAKNIHRA